MLEINCGDDLRDWRLTRNLTQRQLSDLVGVAANNIARWERGEKKILYPKMLSLALERLDEKIGFDDF